jgi:V/A-type H+-transporting ATPase subunit A
MTGIIAKISGPTLTARGLGGAAIGELVRVGDDSLLAEVIRIEGELTTLQVYEDTAGLALGEPVTPSGDSLTVELGPGLLGQVFDGVQRPLSALRALSGDRIGAGLAPPALDRTRRWRFTPAVRAGDRISGGSCLGEVEETRWLRHRVLAPPGAAGVVGEVRAAELTVAEPAVLLENGESLSLFHRWPVKRPRPFRRRLPPDAPFHTGQRILDCLFPIAAGGTAIIPGGFGTGKTVLEQTLAKHAAADVIVYVGCGERGNEMTDLLSEFPALVDPRTGAPLLERTVMVVNTSNMPVAAREASIYVGVTIAEYYRDMGLQVALVADSTSRWAEALREISSRLEEMPGEEGYPTYLAARLAQFYERAGRVEPLGGGPEGAVTLVGAVSPPGGDFSEPVTQASLRVCGGLWALSAELAHRRHYPAVDWGQSFSLYAERLGKRMETEVGEGWSRLRDELTMLLARERELEEIVQLVGPEGVPEEERLILEAARLAREGFLRQSALSEVDASCPPAKTLAMLRAFVTFWRAGQRAIAAGTPLRRVLDSPVPAQLLRLAEEPPDDLVRRSAELVAEIERTLGGLGGAA